MRNILIALIIIIIGCFIFNDISAIHSMNGTVDKVKSDITDHIQQGTDEKEIENILKPKIADIGISDLVISVKGKREYGEEITVTIHYKYLVNSWIRKILNKEEMEIKSTIVI